MFDLTYGYEPTIRHVLKNGVDFDGTRAIFNHTIEFNGLSEFLNSRKGLEFLFIPAYRGSSKISLKYALHEAEWYMMATRDPEYIIPFGPIWDSMRDSDGFVNSNYGFQIKNNNGGDEWLHLASEKFVDDCYATLRIANSENVKLSHDTVCNNEIRITRDGDYVEVDVIARSIDLTFGLPYDMFAAQALVRMIINESKLSYLTLKTLRFHVVNLHIYQRDIPRFNSLLESPSSQEEYYLIDFNQTPYADSGIDLDSLLSFNIFKESIDGVFKNNNPVFKVIDIQLAQQVMNQNEFNRLSLMLKENHCSRKAVSIDNLNRLIYFQRQNKNDEITVISVE